MSIIKGSLRAGFKDLSISEYLRRAGTPTWAGIDVTPETALHISAFFAGIRVIAEDIGKLPFVVYQESADGMSRSRATSSPFWRLIHDRFNSFQTSQQFREYMTALAIMRGNGCARKTVVQGQVRELLPLHPDNVRIEQRPDWELMYHVRAADGTEEHLTRREIFHLPGLTINGPIGISVVEYGRQTIGNAAGGNRQAGTFFGNGMKPSGVFTHPGHIRAEAQKRFKQGLLEDHGGDRSNSVLMVEEGMKFEAVSLNAKDSQFLESRTFEVLEICRWLRLKPHKIAELTRATFCLPAEAEVYTEAGPRRIADIRPNEYVWSLDGNGQWTSSRVVHSAQTGHDEILTIKTTNRTLRLNSRHRVLARRRAAYVSTPITTAPGYSSSRWKSEWCTEWVTAGELKLGDTIATLDVLPEQGIRQSPTRPATVELMEFLGLYLGDGNLMRSSGVRRGVAISRAWAAPYMDHYRASMSSLFLQHGSKPITLQENPRVTRFCSASACLEMEILGFGGNAHEKRVPGWVFRLDADLRLAFLRGFLDADGSVDKKGRISFSSCNHPMLSAVRHLCMGLGIPVTNLNTQQGQTKLPNGRLIAFEQHCFTCSDPAANQRIGSHTPHYIERLEAGQPFNRKGRNYPRHGGRDFVSDSIGLARINSIERQVIAEPVYDLEVEGTHSFIADGVVVHNSNIEQESQEHVTDTLMPWGQRWADAMNQQVIVSRLLYAELLYDALLRGTTLDRYNAYQLAAGGNAPFMSRNEIRQRENLSPREGLDEMLVPLNMRAGQQGGTDGNNSAA